MDCQDSALNMNDEVRRRLSRHNEAWGHRLALWCRHAHAPWWAEGLVISPELRGSYEAWLPLEEYIASICNIARAFLPDADWLPFPLRRRCHNSLPDLWADLPASLGGKVLLGEDELLPLLCAMAEPRSFGTSVGRYAKQLSQLRRHAWEHCHILDVGCGIGINTLEIAAALKEYTPDVTGLTSEWLEVWMARNRRVPHDARREALFPPGNATFIYGDAEHFSQKADIITANGIIGGRFICHDAQYHHFLDCCEASGAKLLFAANHFHQGRYPAIKRFIEIASQRGWNVLGSPNCLIVEVISKL